MRASREHAARLAQGLLCPPLARWAVAPQSEGSMHRSPAQGSCKESPSPIICGIGKKVVVSPDGRLDAVLAIWRFFFEFSSLYGLLNEWSPEWSSDHGSGFKQKVRCTCCLR